MLNKQKKDLKNVHKFWITLGLVVSFFFATLPRITHALTIQPPLQDIVSEPGQSHSVEMTVKNDTGFVEIITFNARAFLAGDEEGVPHFIEDQPHTRWFQIPQKEFILQAHESQTVSIPLSVPLDADPGGYFVALFARARPADNSKTVSYTNEVGSLMFVTVTGEVRRDLELQSIQEKIVNLGQTKLDLSYTLANKGNVHEIPRGTVTIQNIFSTSKNMKPLNSDEFRLLPNSERTLVHTWKPDEAWYSPLNPFRFGIYEAAISIEGISDVQRYRVFVWSPAALAIIGMTALLYFMYKKNRRT